MTKSHARRGGSVALLIALMLSVQGYEIWLKHYIHESMTAAAKRCYDRSANRKPEHCDTRLPDNGAGIDFRWIDSSSNYFVRLFDYGARYPTLDQTVR